ncbi:recQ-mediated genome instability protein 1 [Xylocopa sonorina]|uniref:recQ-mediated genome instability protein 1 n=1 Tax=Xylocopa sonorina TaxID=1818115 RepID=UPI00403AE430
MNADLLRNIKTKLKLEYYLMNDDWLTDCVEFYVNQHENPSTEEILQFVKVQWQLSDLREINNINGSLPINLSQKKFLILSENYILQVEKMYDIATSKYKQLEKIRNIHISEVELSEAEKFEKWEPPKKRMIQLLLTDGLQDVIGIEYNYIPRLNDILLPGYKVMIVGPVKCRRGVLLLEEGNFKGIGGELDSLLVPNALENVLARALKLPENPDPYNDNETKSNNNKQEEPHVPNEIDASFFEEDFEINLEDVSNIENSHSKSQEPKDVIKIKDEPEIENVDTVFRKDLSCKEEQILSDDECLLEMIDERQLIEPKIEQKNIIAPFRTLPKEENDDIIIINDEEEIADVKYDIFKNSMQKNFSQSNSTLFSSKAESSPATSHLKVEKKQQSVITGGKRTVPMSPPEVISSKKGKIDRQITEFTKALSATEEPKICEFIHTIKDETITETTIKTIRGHVEVLGKLTKKDSLWILEASIADGTSAINVSFSNKVLENLLGFSVQEFSIRKKLIAKNPEIEQELRMSFRNAEQKIKTLDALLELELNTNSKPTVVKIIDLTEQQKEILDKRLKNFLLKSNV